MRARTSPLHAFAAMGAIGAAAIAQILLEQSRIAGIDAGLLPFYLFIAAAAATLFATSSRKERASGQQAIEIILPAARWWLACLPGLALLILAASVRMWAGDTITFSLWAGGIILLLVAGALHAARRDPVPAAALEWSRRRLLCAYALLALVTVAVNTAFDFSKFPSFVEADEAFYAIYARELGNTRPLAWFDLYMVGMPNMQVVPFLITEKLFGGDLWGARVAGVIMGTAGVLCTFGFARRLIGNLPGLTAALLLAAAHTHVHYSRTAQIFIETPVAAAVTLLFFVRAWSGGSLLAWIGAGIALGIGTQTYYASYVLPVLIAFTALGWAWSSGVAWTRVVGMTLVVEVIALLVLAPVGMAMYVNYDLAATRPRSLLMFSPENMRAIGEHFYAWLWMHTIETLTMFNTGRDALSAYGAQRSFVDAVTAAMVPPAAAFALRRLRSPVGWLCLSWVAAYLLIGVWLIPAPPTYQRVPAALLFTSIAVAWTLAHLAATIRDGFGLRPGFVGLVCMIFAAGAVGANVHFYFVEYRQSRPTVHTMGFAQLACGYAATHTLVDATTLDGHEFIPRKQDQLLLDCPLANRLDSLRATEMWDIAAMTSDPKVVLIAPQQIVEAHPGEPKGYQVVRRYTDERIGYPAPLPLAVYELERAAN